MTFITVLKIISYVASAGIPAFFLIKKNIEIKKDLEAEQLRTAAYKEAMANNSKLVEQYNNIDNQIEEKKRDRKKLSKNDKISAANNRSNYG